MNEKKEYVLLDILEEYYQLKNLKTINLTDFQIQEIIRQIFDRITGDLKSSLFEINRLNYSMVFINHEQIPENCMDELKEIIVFVVMNVYKKLNENKLLHNYYPDIGFPFFAELITSNTVYLRLDPRYSPLPY